MNGSNDVSYTVDDRFIRKLQILTQPNHILSAILFAFEL